MDRQPTDNTFRPLFISQETANAHGLAVGDMFTYCGSRYKSGHYVIVDTVTVDDGDHTVFKCQYMDMHNLPKLFEDKEEIRCQ